MTRDWIKIACDAHELTAAGEAMATYNSDQSTTIPSKTLYAEYDLTTILLDCYVLLQRFPQHDSRIYAFYFGLPTGFTAQKNLQQENNAISRALGAYLNPDAITVIAPYLPFPIDELCIKIAPHICDLWQRWYVLCLGLNNAGPSSPIWEYAMTWSASLNKGDLYHQIELRLLKMVPVDPARRLARQNNRCDIGAQLYLVVIKKSKDQTDYDEAFECAKSLNHSRNKVVLLLELVSCEENATRVEVGKYALTLIEQKDTYPDADKAKIFGIVLSVDQKNLPQITRDARAFASDPCVQSSLFASAKLVYERLLRHGDRNQFEKIVEEALACAAQKPALSDSLFLTLLDVTSGQKREKIIAFIHDTNTTNDAKVWVKCAQNPPEHLRASILSHLLCKITDCVKCFQDRVLLYIAYLKLVSQADCQKNMNLIYRFVIEMNQVTIVQSQITVSVFVVDDPQLRDAKREHDLSGNNLSQKHRRNLGLNTRDQFLQAEFFAELLKKVEGKKQGQSIFNLALLIAQNMQDPLAHAHLFASLLEHSGRLIGQEEHERLNQCVIALLENKQATQAVKHIFYGALLDHGTLPQPMEEALFTDIQRENPERNLQAASLLAKLVKKASKDIERVIAYATVNLTFMKHPKERTELFQAILGRLAGNKELIADRRKLFESLFNNPSIELFDNLLKPAKEAYLALFEGEAKEEVARQFDSVQAKHAGRSAAC